MKLLNVRLNPEDARKVKALRGQGVKISSLVREAIHQAYDRRKNSRQSQNTESLRLSLLEEFPTLMEGPPRQFDIHDRHAFATAFAEHIRSKSRR